MQTVAEPFAATHRWWLGALLAVSLAVLALCATHPPRWETNDDVGMAMVAHGYGMAASGSPNLIFSNVVWGHIVRLVPSLGGISGYAVATFAVLVAVGTALLYGLRRLGHGWWLGGCVVAFLLVRPVLLPQFTVNAGLMAVAAVICLNVYAQARQMQWLWLGVGLLFLSAMVRSHECMLVMLVALPLLPWRALARGHAPRWAFAVLALALLAAAWLDWQAYRAPEWKDFNDLNLVRAAFTDFGAGQHLIARPEILDRYGYTANDLALLGNWFFSDPRLADPMSLKAMLADVGFLALRTNALASGWEGVRALWQPDLRVSLAAALSLGLLLPNRKVAATWLLCIAAVFMMGLLGRPGVLRVYVPLMALLAVAPLLFNDAERHRRRPVVFATVVLAAVVGAWMAVGLWQALQHKDEQARRELDSMPSGSIVVWGAAFPFEAVYPPFSNAAVRERYRLYSLGAFTLVPGTVARQEDQAGRGFVSLLQRKEGVAIFAFESHLRWLDVYCSQRLHGVPEQLQTWRAGNQLASRRRCTAVP